MFPTRNRRIRSHLRKDIVPEQTGAVMNTYKRPNKKANFKNECFNCKKGDTQRKIVIFQEATKKQYRKK